MYKLSNKQNVTEEVSHTTHLLLGGNREHTNVLKKEVSHDATLQTVGYHELHTYAVRYIFVLSCK